MSRFQVTAFYRFSPISASFEQEVESSLLSFSKEVGDLGGLVILAPEGINGTVAGSPKTIDRFKEVVRGFEPFSEILFKDSWCKKAPFPRFKVKHREEIVTLHRNDLVPRASTNNHLPPAEWNRVLEEDQEVVVLDTRNRYETRLGMFKGALDPEIDTFGEFARYVESAGIPKEKKVLMYCTGGIRCEKAILEMQQLGYEQVYQLEGGILKYLEEFPQGKFRGECFVFDHRVAVQADLEPSERFRLCPHCGDPGDQRIICKRCERGAVICQSCLQIEERNTCSKDCGHHFQRKNIAA